MKEIFKLIGVLTLISAAAGLLLAFTNNRTAGPIAQARNAESLRALAEVLPAFDNKPNETVFTVEENGQHWTFFVARQKGAFAGAAVESSSLKGYGGLIKIMIGINPDNSLRRFKILEQQETPGLGSKIVDATFLSHFKNRPFVPETWRLKKDGGEIEAITGATISSRAVTEAIRIAAEVYSRHADEIRRTGLSATP
jgi:electron transport complex protein RnfG